jgi:predicted Rdx family selenoprotein
MDESDQPSHIQQVLIWDRKAEGGFPETKVLKQRIRDHLQPDRDLGHSDTAVKKEESERPHVSIDAGSDCRDCP